MGGGCGGVVVETAAKAIVPVVVAVAIHKVYIYIYIKHDMIEYEKKIQYNRKNKRK